MEKSQDALAAQAGAHVDVQEIRHLQGTGLARLDRLARRISKIEGITDPSLQPNRRRRSKARVDRSEDLAEKVTESHKLLVGRGTPDRRLVALALEIGYVSQRVIDQGLLDRRERQILRSIGERKPEQICRANGRAFIDEISAAGREEMKTGHPRIANHTLNPP